MPNNLTHITIFSTLNIQLLLVTCYCKLVFSVGQGATIEQRLIELSYLISRIINIYLTGLSIFKIKQ